MSLKIGSRSINHVVVIGSGQIGPDIALHFAKSLLPVGGQVTVIDVNAAALASGLAKITKKIDKGEQTGAFKPAQAAALKAMLNFTADYVTAATADLVVEAATEDEALKGRIFRQLEGLCRSDTVFLSNSSHLEPERIFASLQHKERTAVAHYFFPAERNPVVEIVRGSDTSAELNTWLLRFYEAIGKVPIAVASRYGYAADPIFEGIFAAACLCVQDDLGTVKEVDYAARKALGMTVGPFTAMNLTGGNPITQHGLDLMHERFATSENPHPWYKAPQLLNDLLAVQGSSGQWFVCGRGETAEIEPAREKKISDALQAAYLALTFGIVDSGIIALDDFELCLEMALDLTGPCRLANQIGVANALKLVQTYAATQSGLPVPQVLKLQAELGRPFEPSHLIQQDFQAPGGVVRVVTIRRPKVLNALNHVTYSQIAAAVSRAEADSGVAAIVLTGFGNKAFVSGADIHALANVRTPDDGYAIAKLGQDVARQVELTKKPVIAALNGLAFGGGLELALACHARIAVADLRALAALPEVNLGIIPGSGGTQRLPRLIGLEKANVALRTGQTFSSQAALDCGLVQQLASADDLLQTAVNLAVAAGKGELSLAPLQEYAITSENVQLAEVDIGHRSRAVDALLCAAIIYGATHDLKAGLARELAAFRDICALQDMRIGIDHFVSNGTKTPAPFIHA